MEGLVWLKWDKYSLSCHLTSRKFDVIQVYCMYLADLQWVNKFMSVTVVEQKIHNKRRLQNWIFCQTNAMPDVSVKIRQQKKNDSSHHGAPKNHRKQWVKSMKRFSWRAPLMVPTPPHHLHAHNNRSVLLVAQISTWTLQWTRAVCLRGDFTQELGGGVLPQWQR